ncbi:hypothetical protein [Devosia sp. 1566]|uniref:hypothetical protein n=1 Tax=Devosia sp. 1566 TaxID=2499144 RepID=UPI000FD91293|nr:hypothetical protein [Devosia sp. 1566]
MSASKTNRINELEAQKARIEAQLDQHKVRQLRQDTKRTDRLHVLLGSFLLADMKRNPKLRAYVERHLLDFHTRQRDRDFLATFLDGLPKDE